MERGSTEVGFEHDLEPIYLTSINLGKNCQNKEMLVQNTRIEMFSIP